LFLFLLLTPDWLRAEDWPQFRGSRSAGISQSTQKLPVEVSRDSFVIWKTPVSGGHSSPVLFGNRIYLTTATNGKLSTVALDRATGTVLWEAPAPYDQLEKIHRTGSHAQSSSVTDGNVVISFFGSSGLLAYDSKGNLLWSHRMGPFKNDFGAGSSPIIEDDLVILVQDHDLESFVAAYDKHTGREVWRTDRSEFLRNYATPTIWVVDGKKQIVVSGTLRIVGYDLETGREAWTVKGVSRIVNMTPVIGPDNTLYAACWSPGNEGDDRVEPLTVDELFAADADKNGTVEENEFPDHPLKRRFTQLDRNKDGHLSKAEYQSVARAHSDGKNVFLAILPGGQGDITKSHVRWEQTKQLPYCPSPLYYDGHIYLVKDGGILSVLDAANGHVLKQSRLKATGNYYASPIAGDGKVFLLSQNGVLTVLSAVTGWEELYSFDFGSDGHATPAIADGRLYVRVGNELYCFGLPEQRTAAN
jgi:outer membrane protein assembly factor BamB